MLNIKNRKGFSLLELIVAITAISIISSIIYKTYSSMQEIDRKSTMIREMDSIKKNMTDRLKNIEILEGTLVSSSNIYYNDKIAFEKDKFIKLDDTKEKQDFWGLSSNQYKKYIYAQSKYFTTANGNIPYTDFWVIMVGPKLDKLYKQPEYMLNELFVFEGDKGLSTRFTKNFINGAASLVPTVENGTFDPKVDGYPIAQSKGIKENIFKQELKNVVILKVSTQEIVLDKYKETLLALNNYSKNLKDWASIQMSMYENIIAKYGGSYNIDYFVSLGLGATSDIKGSSLYNFKKEMIYSSIDLDNTDNPIRDASGNEQGFTDILESKFDSTNYGIVICGGTGCINNLSDTSIISMYGDQIEVFDGTINLPFGDSEIIIDNSISLDSNRLLPGSKSIFGIGNTNGEVYNAFGKKYKYYFSNVKDWSIKWTDPENNGTETLSYTQNVPVQDSYAPYSATIFTIFPWFMQNVKDLADPLSKGKENKSDGYVDSKIFPELR